MKINTKWYRSDYFLNVLTRPEVIKTVKKELFIRVTTLKLNRHY